MNLSMRNGHNYLDITDSENEDLAFRLAYAFQLFHQPKHALAQILNPTMPQLSNPVPQLETVPEKVQKPKPGPKYKPSLPAIEGIVELPLTTPPIATSSTKLGGDGFPNPWKDAAKIAISMNAPFRLSAICRTRLPSMRENFKKWLIQNFDVDIVPQTPDKPAHVSNPYIVLPFHYERGIKHYARLPQPISKEAVKGGHAKTPYHIEVMDEIISEDVSAHSVA